MPKMVAKLTLKDPSSTTSFFSFNQTEDESILLYPECFNIIVLTSVLIPMYNGIEIEHPIYKILFCSLFVSLLSSITSFVCFFFNPITVLKFSKIINVNNWVCVMYHYTSWSILSILRYIYIKHRNWLYKKFPNTSTIGNLATGAIVLSCGLEFLLCIVVFTLSGWPRVKTSEVSKSVFIMRGMTPLIILLSLIGISCYFYAKILRDRKVGDVLIATAVSQDNIELNNLEVKTSEFGGIWTGQHANSVEENRWKSNHCTKSKQRSFNKVDVFVIEASQKIPLNKLLLF
jgi:hypothetical protein